MATQTKLKITLAKLLELSIDTNKEVALKIIRSKGSFKLTVDHNGNAKLSGSAGILTFKGNPVLEELGATVKFVSILFGKNDDNTINYSGTFKIGVYSMSLSGDIDIEKLILGCSGLLCAAARALKNRNNNIRERMLQEVMK